MKNRVTEHRPLIPKRLLEGVDEVDSQKNGSVAVAAPVSVRDPILELGIDPIRLEIEDASEHHDRYILLDR